MIENERVTEELEARIARLEENLWFQERKLEDLDNLLKDLQAEQNTILRQLELGRQMIMHMKDVLDAQGHCDPRTEAPPPHYQQLK